MSEGSTAGGKKIDPAKVRTGRGRGFPVAWLPDAVQVIKAAGAHGMDHTRSAFAGYMGLSSATSGAYQRRIASLKDYGLIMSGDDRISLTELARQIALPLDGASEKASIRTAFDSADTFKDMLDRLPHGKPVPYSTIGNTAVHELGVSAVSRDQFARSFAESAIFAGLARQTGADAIELLGAGPQQDEEVHTVRVPSDEPLHGSPQTTVRHPWRVSGGEVLFEVRLDHPLPIEAWTRIGAVMEAMTALVETLDSLEVTSGETA